MIESPFPSIDAEDYQRLRQDYPQEAIDWLVSEAELGRGARVLDAGAGTGQASRPLVDAGVRVIAMEPAPNLRSKLSEVISAASVVGGVAETMPFRDGALDAVVAGQSFQWFDGPRAVPEIHRVLRPGGALAVIWIESDEQSTLHREMWAAVDPTEEESAIDQAQGRWNSFFEGSDLFEPFRTGSFPFTRRLAASDVPTFLSTSSDLAVMPAEEREAALRAVGEWAERQPPEIEFPMVVDVHLTFRSG